MRSPPGRLMHILHRHIAHIRVLYLYPFWGEKGNTGVGQDSVSAALFKSVAAHRQTSKKPHWFSGLMYSLINCLNWKSGRSELMSVQRLLTFLVLMCCIHFNPARRQIHLQQIRLLCSVGFGTSHCVWIQYLLLVVLLNQLHCMQKTQAWFWLQSENNVWPAVSSVLITVLSLCISLGGQPFHRSLNVTGNKKT